MCWMPTISKGVHLESLFLPGGAAVCEELSVCVVQTIFCCLHPLLLLLPALDILYTFNKKLQNVLDAYYLHGCAA